jgi:hypothetical protein
MKLIAITLPLEKPPELRLQRHLDLLNPVDTVLGWQILVRGSSVILLDPKGKGYQISTAACVLMWDGRKPEDYDQIAKYTSDVIARPAAKREPTDEELERATAPKAVAK